MRRLLALAAIYDGASRTEAARIGGVTLQIVRDWAVRFNAQGPAGLIDRKAPGKAPTLGPEARAALARAVEEGPTPWRDGVVRWRLIDLVQWLRERFGVSVSETTMGRELRAMGLRKLNARPRHHAQDPGGAGGVQKKGLSRRPGGDRPGRAARQAGRDLVRRRGAHRAEEQDHPPLGEAGHPAAGAPRPAHEWAHIFGAICPAEGKGAGLVMPWCDTPAMQAHLLEISAAVLLLDRAGWHLSGKLAVPANVTILPLPPRSPDLNPVENVRQFLRDNWLSNRVFRSHDDIVAHCCDARNALMDQPWRNRSIGRRDWADAFNAGWY